MSRFIFPADHVHSAAEAKAAAVASLAWRQRIWGRSAPAPIAPPSPPPPPDEPPEPRLAGIPVGSRQILKAVAAHFEVTVEDILGASRSRRFVAPRHVAMWLLRERGLSLPQVAKRTGRADHTSVIHGCRRIEATPALKAAALSIMRRLEELAAVPPENGSAVDGQ